MNEKTVQDTWWLDKSAYAFERSFFESPVGRMHYIDEGKGKPVVFLHGNPTWSFLYRHLIGGLVPHFRCIAPDLIGFGLSDKPSNWSYLPEDHAQVVGIFLDQLQVTDMTLVVHDFGGPIGLSYAITRPEKVRRLVLFNTWMWSLNRDVRVQIFSRAMRTPIGKLLCLYNNFFTRFVMRPAIGDKSSLERHTHNQYLGTHPRPADRKGTWVFPKSLLGSSDWYNSLWHRRDRIRDKAALLLWGMKDPAFGKNYLQRWQQFFVDSQTVEYELACHYVPEEVGEDLIPVVRKFLSN